MVEGRRSRVGIGAPTAQEDVHTINRQATDLHAPAEHVQPGRNDVVCRFRGSERARRQKRRERGELLAGAKCAGSRDQAPGLVGEGDGFEAADTARSVEQSPERLERVGTACLSAFHGSGANFFPIVHGP